MEQGEAIVAYVALGSNLGDRSAMIETGVERIDALERVRVVSRSGVIETEPIGAPGQGAYLNAVVGVETTLEPMDLLRALLEVERSMGRRRDPAERWGARTIDLDLVLYAEAIVDEPGLSVPHPRMHERGFVLGPLAEIAPEAIHPVLGRSVRELLAKVREGA